jgi:UDPglucose 6-dehydrogenase
VIRPLLWAGGAVTRACDPQWHAKAEELLPGIEWCHAALEAAAGADVLVVLTEWNEFRALDLNEVRQVMRGNVLVDLRNIYRDDLAGAAGFAYHAIGRPAPSQLFEGAGYEAKAQGAGHVSDVKLSLRNGAAP